MDLILYIKAIISRLLFIGHGIIAVYIYWEYERTKSLRRQDFLDHGKSEFFLVAPLFFILAEAVVTLGYRRGIEFKYFWPSGFLYITCLIPIIWLIELDMVGVRSGVSEAIAKISSTNMTSESHQEKGQLLLKAKLISNEGVKKITELGLVLGVIIGRWLIPRGTLTRDQLSALLLGYVSNSADILELFSVFEEEEVFQNRDVTIGVMVVFTIALYQFPLVTTATMETDEEETEKPSLKRDNNNNNNNNNNRVHPVKEGPRPLTYTQQLRLVAAKRSQTAGNKPKSRLTPLGEISEKSVTNRDAETGTEGANHPSSKRNFFSRIKRKPKAINEGQTSQEEEGTVKRRKIHGETFQILVTLLMQDGPFLALRLYLLIKHTVASELHIFFTCKNAIVSVLLIYRLLILSCEEEEESPDLELQREAAEAKLHNIQLALEDYKIQEVNGANIYVQ